jgi:hypothetical protein
VVADEPVPTNPKIDIETEVPEKAEDSNTETAEAAGPKNP